MVMIYFISKYKIYSQSCTQKKISIFKYFKFFKSQFSGGSVSKGSTCNAGDLGSILVGKIPWRREWQPTLVFLPRERVPWTEEPGGLQSMGSQRVRHNLVTNTFPFSQILTQRFRNFHVS